MIPSRTPAQPASRSPRRRRHAAAVLGAALVSTLAVTAPAAGQELGRDLVYSSVLPCRVIDTRLQTGGALAANTTRAFHIVGSSNDFVAQGGKSGGCGVPGFRNGAPRALAVMINLVAVDPGGKGHLRAYPTDAAQVPTASALNFAPLGMNFANGLAVPLRRDSEGGDLTILSAFATSHVVADVVGYFAAPVGPFHAVRDVSNDIAVETTGGTNAWARLWMITPSQQWAWGTSENFNGNQLYLVDWTWFSQTRMTVQPLGGPISFPVGNVGIGTGSPTTRLHVAGDLTVDAANPTLFTGTGGAELNRYLHVINSTDLQSASGLKAGGVLVSDSYAFANPGKNHLVVKGTAVIGAANAPSGGVGLYATGALVGVQGAGSSQGVRGEGAVYGVFARATNTSNSYALYGQQPNTCATCWAGYFDGSARVTSALSVGGSGSFGSAVFATDFVETSDRNEKANFADVDPRSVLETLAAIPIQTWNFKSQPESVRHMGPMAQDFHAAFGLGHDDKHISTVDAAGVSLAAIQGLYQMLQEKEQQIAELQARLDRLERGEGRVTTD
jgi:hypothetical protein